jgi:hypothetical protein
VTRKEYVDVVEPDVILKQKVYLSITNLNITIISHLSLNSYSKTIFYYPHMLLCYTYRTALQKMMRLLKLQMNVSIFYILTSMLRVEKLWLKMIRLTQILVWIYIVYNVLLFQYLCKSLF